jgi:hypothetical protein
MVAEDFLQDPQVRHWLGGVEPAWTLLTFESLRALPQEPSTVQTAIRIANDLSADEVAGSPVARNTLILLRQATERHGLPLTATGNLSRAVVAEMCKLIQWPDYDQADAFQQGDQRTRLLAVACRSPASSSSNFGARTAQEAGSDAIRQVHAERRTASELTGDSVSSCFLALGPGLLQPRVARVLAAGGRRGRALVAVSLRQ